MNCGEESEENGFLSRGFNIYPTIQKQQIPVGNLLLDFLMKWLRHELKLRFIINDRGCRSHTRAHL